MAMRLSLDQAQSSAWAHFVAFRQLKVQFMEGCFQYAAAMWVCMLGALTCDYIMAFEDIIISKLKGDFAIIWWFPSRPYSGCLSGHCRSRLRDRQCRSLVGLTGFRLRDVLWAVGTFARFNRMCFLNVGNLRSSGARQLSRNKDPVDQPSNSSSC